MPTSRLVAAALAATLAVPAAAAPDVVERTQEEARRRAAEQEAARRRERPGKAAAPEGTPSPLSPAQREAIGAALARGEVAMAAGALARHRGESEEVRSLGRWLAEDHRQVKERLAGLLRERGADPATLPIGDADRLRENLEALTLLSGPEFDRAFVAFLTRTGPEFVEAMKRARGVTPGSDAQLKRYLDQAENLEEGHLTAARLLSQQRQARKPPARPSGR